MTCRVNESHGVLWLVLSRRPPSFPLPRPHLLVPNLISSPFCSYSTRVMSSPPQPPMSPPQDFWTDDVDMQDNAEPSSDAPAAQPLFLASTPSAAGTPARRSNIATPGSRTSEVARRAVGLSTPRGKTPLFAGQSFPRLYGK